MIEEASVAIAEVSERDRLQRQAKYARRNKMRYIDQLLNELEMLNLAEQKTLPRPIAAAVVELVRDSEVDAVVETTAPDAVTQAMDALYEIQDSLMFNQIEDE